MQVITGSHDKTIRLWDIRSTSPKTLATLTYHKKAVRAMALGPTDYTFTSCGADNIKKYQLPAGTFLNNTLQNQKAIINAAAVNEDGVLATGADNGSLWYVTGSIPTPLPFQNLSIFFLIPSPTSLL
jgi:pleiotropic regulator 1